jgi:hypothetical protein
MMRYDTSKTLNEQTAYEMQLDKTFSDPKKASEYLDTQRQMVKDVGNLIKKGANWVYKCGSSFVSGDVDGFSKCLTSLRDKMYTMEGLSLTAAVEVLGSEVGVPILVEDLGYLFLINDSTNFVKNYATKSPPKNLTVGQKFSWLWSNNEDFKRVIEDILFMLFNVVGPYVAKGASNIVSQLLLKIGGKEGKNIFVKLGEWFATKSTKSSEPMVTKFISKQKKGLEDMVKIFKEDLGSTTSKIVKKIIPASITGTLTYVLGTYLSEKFAGLIKKYNQEKISSQNVLENPEVYKRHFILENPSVFGTLTWTLPKSSNKYNIDFYFERNSDGTFNVKYDTEGDGKIDGPYEITKEENPDLYNFMNGAFIVATENKDFVDKYIQTFKVLSPYEFCINSKYYKTIETNSWKIKEFKDIYNKCLNSFESPYKSEWMSSQTPKTNLVNKYK